MQGRNRILFLFLLTALILPQVAFGQGNIYQEAIPHIKACISLIKEQETQVKVDAASFDLRDVCPTLMNFLSYEPISEIDPPLENQSGRAYLESLATLLESVYQPVHGLAQKSLEHQLDKYIPVSEPEQKPFLMAMAQWTFAHVNKWLVNFTKPATPRTQHIINIATLNFAIVLLSSMAVLYLIAYSRGSAIYRRHFQIRWQKSRPAEQILSLEMVIRLKMHLQIPALVKLVKQELCAANIPVISSQSGNDDFIADVSNQQPDIAREVARLIRLHDRIQYGNKKPAADEINQAIDLTRKILATIQK
jgi:hypothetical protein